MLWRGTAWRPRICGALSPWAPDPTKRTGTPGRCKAARGLLSCKATAAGSGTQGPTSSLRAQARRFAPGGAGHSGRCSSAPGAVVLQDRRGTSDYKPRQPALRKLSRREEARRRKARNGVRLEAWASGLCAPGLRRVPAAAGCKGSPCAAFAGPQSSSRSVHSGTPNLVPNRDLVKNSRTVCNAVRNKALGQGMYSLGYVCNSNY